MMNKIMFQKALNLFIKLMNLNADNLMKGKFEDFPTTIITSPESVILEGKGTQMVVAGGFQVSETFQVNVPNLFKIANSLSQLHGDSILITKTSETGILANTFGQEVEFDILSPEGERTDYNLVSWQELYQDFFTDVKFVGKAVLKTRFIKHGARALSEDWVDDKESVLSHLYLHDNLMFAISGYETRLLKMEHPYTASYISRTELLHLEKSLPQRKKNFYISFREEDILILTQFGEYQIIKALPIHKHPVFKTDVVLDKVVAKKDGEPNCFQITPAQLKTLMSLDTRTGTVADDLYAIFNFEKGLFSIKKGSEEQVAPCTFQYGGDMRETISLTTAPLKQMSTYKGLEFVRGFWKPDDKVAMFMLNERMFISLVERRNFEQEEKDD